jgi:hypothetical protein
MAKKPISNSKAKRIRRRLRQGLLKQPVRVSGEIDFSGDGNLKVIQPQLRGCDRLILRGCINLTTLPQDLKVDVLDVSGCTSLRKLPPGLRAKVLIAENSGLRGMAASVRVSHQMNLRNCRYLKQLPNKLRVSYLMLAGCTALERLPDKMRIAHLDVTGCTALQDWGEGSSFVRDDTSEIHYRQYRRPLSHTLIARDCTQISELPNWLRTLQRLDIRNCDKLGNLPSNLAHVYTLEIGNTNMDGRPPNVIYDHLNWNGVRINAKIAWAPQLITIEDIWREENLEVRRVMIERMGYERFFREADAEIIDIDEDAGGERQLLRVTLPRATMRWQRGREEPIVCLSVSCPSTARQYVLRVPPHVRTCHQGAAWIAGFDDPALYNPVLET